jgi:hypothetical protein
MPSATVDGVARSSGEKLNVAQASTGTVHARAATVMRLRLPTNTRCRPLKTPDSADGDKRTIADRASFDVNDRNGGKAAVEPSTIDQSNRTLIREPTAWSARQFVCNGLYVKTPLRPAYNQHGKSRIIAYLRGPHRCNLKSPVIEQSNGRYSCRSRNSVHRHRWLSDGQ